MVFIYYLTFPLREKTPADTYIRVNPALANVTFSFSIAILVTMVSILNNDLQPFFIINSVSIVLFSEVCQALKWTLG